MKKPSWWNDEEAKKYKLCEECKGLGKRIVNNVLVKCKPCKGKGYLKK